MKAKHWKATNTSTNSKTQIPTLTITIYTGAQARLSFRWVTSSTYLCNRLTYVRKVSPFSYKMYSGYATTSSLPFCPNMFFGTAASGPKSNATAVSPRDAVYALLKWDLKTNLLKTGPIKGGGMEFVLNRKHKKLWLWGMLSNTGKLSESRP